MSNKRGLNYVIPIRPVPRKRTATSAPPPSNTPPIRPTPQRYGALSKGKKEGNLLDEVPNDKDIELFQRVWWQVRTTRILPKGTKKFDGKRTSRANLQYHLKNLRTFLKKGPTKYTDEVTSSVDWYRLIMDDYESNQLPLDVYYLLNNHPEWTWERKPGPISPTPLRRPNEKTDPNKAALQYNIQQRAKNDALKARAEEWKKSKMSSFIQKGPKFVECVECNKEMTRQASEKHSWQACFRNKHGHNKCIYCHKEFGNMRTRQAHEPKCDYIERVVTVN